MYAKRANIHEKNQSKESQNSARFPLKNTCINKTNTINNKVQRENINYIKDSAIVPLKMSSIDKILQDVHSILPKTDVELSLAIPPNINNGIEKSEVNVVNNYEKVEFHKIRNNQQILEPSIIDNPHEEIAKKKLQQLEYMKELQQQILAKQQLKQKNKIEANPQIQIENTKNVPKDDKASCITGSRRAYVPNRIDVIFIKNLGSYRGNRNYVL